MKPRFKIVEEPLSKLADYARIPMRFEVDSVFDVVVDERGLGGMRFVERPLPHPWIKDYDEYDEERPIHWAERWDISNWGLLTAYVDGRMVGGCALAYNTNGVNMLEGRDDLVVMWDLRIHPDFRRMGIGGRLFETAVSWAKSRSCKLLKVETQNINVRACRFYAKQGCELGSIHRFAYPDLPDEVQLFWYYRLT